MSEPTDRDAIGVILLNLGGPERLEDVEPFLFNLFSDRQIIRLSPFAFLQKIIARKIAAKRSPKSRKAYRLIGGGSPLARITAEQGQSLEKALQKDKVSFKVKMAMRYWPPFADETLKLFAQNKIKKIVALTLYPHYSKATTGSSLIDLYQAASQFSTPFEIDEISSWPTHPPYISSLAVRISQKAKLFTDDFQLIYSAHSLPVKFIEEGDPYLAQVKQTILEVEKLTGIKGRLCFQSRSGPVQWLSPSTPEMIKKLSDEGCKNILLMPISFVSDHLETLYEIDIMYRQQAAALGMQLIRTESLNSSPDFIAGLAQLITSISAGRNNEAQPRSLINCSGVQCNGN